MKVKELIEKLKQYDSELEVLAETGDGTVDIKGVEIESGDDYMWVLLYCMNYIKP